MTERYKPRIYQTHFDLEKEPSKTKQSFADQCDINRILDKAARTGVLSHINKHAQSYGDFTDFDFEEAQIQLARANSIFYELEPEVRAEFGNKPKNFFQYVSNPENADSLQEKLPKLLEPGRQLPDINNTQALADAVKTGVIEGLSEGSKDAPSPEESP